jgi:hypothetical protein
MDCPEGLVVDAISRFSGCNTSVKLQQGIAWCWLLSAVVVAPSSLFTAAKLHLHDPTISPARVQSLVLIGLGYLFFVFWAAYPVFRPNEPYTSNPLISWIAGLGVAAYGMGVIYYYAGHLLASVFFMVYALQPEKAHMWIKRLKSLSSVIGVVLGGGMGVAVIAPCYLHDEASIDIVLMVTFTTIAVATGILALFGFLAVADLKALQKTISAESSTGTALKRLVPVLTMATVVSANFPPNWLIFAFVPWLRHRANTAWLLLAMPLTPMQLVINAYEMYHLHKRQAATQRITPTVVSTKRRKTTTRITQQDKEKIAATKYALCTKQLLRRGPNASSVYGSGVSLAFLELYVRECDIPMSMDAREFVIQFVKVSGLQV